MYQVESRFFRSRHGGIRQAIEQYKTLRSSKEKPNTLTLAPGRLRRRQRRVNLSPQGRGYLRIAPPLRGGDKGEGG